MFLDEQVLPVVKNYQMQKFSNRVVLKGGLTTMVAKTKLCCGVQINRKLHTIRIHIYTTRVLSAFWRCFSAGRATDGLPQRMRACDSLLAFSLSFFVRVSAALAGNVWSKAKLGFGIDIGNNNIKVD